MIYTIFIIPITIILIGYLLFKYPPKNINYLIGYRSIKSMKNDKIWKFANQYCGKLLIKTGILMLIITIMLFILSCFKVLIFTEQFLIIVIFLEVLALLLSGFMTEKNIKDNK